MNKLLKETVTMVINQKIFSFFKSLSKYFSVLKPKITESQYLNACKTVNALQNLYKSQSEQKDSFYLMGFYTHVDNKVFMDIENSMSNTKKTIEKGELIIKSYLEQEDNKK
jgi:hypothetical protein